MTHRSILGAIAGVLVGAVVVMSLVSLAQQSTVLDAVRQTQKSNTVKNNQNTETLRIVQDCTSPGGKCYQRGQKQTASAVGNINRVVILAAACSVGLDPNLPVSERQNRISICVIGRLARQK